MPGNEGVTKYSKYSTGVRTTKRQIADADPQNILEPPTDGGYLCSNPIFTNYISTTYDSISTRYIIDDTKAAG